MHRSATPVECRGGAFAETALGASSPWVSEARRWKQEHLAIVSSVVNAHVPFADARFDGSPDATRLWVLTSEGNSDEHTSNGALPPTANAE